MIRHQREQLDREQPPDLQELVTAHGGYDKITADAWAKYDHALAQWRSTVAVGDHRSAYRYRGLRR